MVLSPFFGIFKELNSAALKVAFELYLRQISITKATGGVFYVLTLPPMVTFCLSQSPRSEDIDYNRQTHLFSHLESSDFTDMCGLCSVAAVQYLKSAHSNMQPK